MTLMNRATKDGRIIREHDQIRVPVVLLKKWTADEVRDFLQQCKGQRSLQH